MAALPTSDQLQRRKDAEAAMSRASDCIGIMASWLLPLLGFGVCVTSTWLLGAGANTGRALISLAVGGMLVLVGRWAQPRVLTWCRRNERKVLVIGTALSIAFFVGPSLVRGGMALFE